MTQNGKGDAPRPMKISREQFGSNFDRVFNKNTDIKVVPPEMMDKTVERVLEQVRNALKVPSNVLGIDK